MDTSTYVKYNPAIHHQSTLSSRSSCTHLFFTLATPESFTVSLWASVARCWVGMHKATPKSALPPTTGPAWSEGSWGGAQSHQGVQRVPVSDQCTHVKLVYRPHPPRNDKLVAQGRLIPVSLRRLGLPDRQHPPARSPQQGHPPCTGRSRRCQRSDYTRPRSQTPRPRASAGGTGAALHHSLHQLPQGEEKHMC